MGFRLFDVRVYVGEGFFDGEGFVGKNISLDVGVFEFVEYCFFFLLRWKGFMLLVVGLMVMMSVCVWILVFLFVLLFLIVV